MFNTCCIMSSFKTIDETTNLTLAFECFGCKLAKRNKCCNRKFLCKRLPFPCHFSSYPWFGTLKRTEGGKWGILGKDTYKWSSSGNLPSSEGTRPVNLFSLMYKYRNNFSCASSIGMAPLSVLKLRNLQKASPKQTYKRTYVQDNITHWPVDPLTFACK